MSAPNYAEAAESPPPVQSGSEPPEAEPPLPVQSGSESPKPEAEKGDQEEEEEEEEEEGECGFCLYMKSGGCKDEFIDWEKCIEEAEKNKEDLVEKCAKATAVLKQCMDSHSDYYEPILRAEKDAEKKAIDELEKEKEAESQSLQNASKDGDGASDSKV
ncbi:PREDICTED: transcriptional regulator Myc-like isoform X2 [Lupinus angustifolius]|uniref:transcriptional regulator Myc-like isoform X2 n=1 Tax=Lupinus angustifolius TaxID=3871 RepID=UPI00092F3CC5|nr:PREDICTED: transcriptional regulator Myc-like isoform X2 [Lupinus angustifolius]